MPYVRSAGAIIFYPPSVALGNLRRMSPINSESELGQSVSVDRYNRHHACKSEWLHKKGREIEYLLIKYRAGHWEFPRGHVEKGESDIEAAKREIKEETGLKNLVFIPDFRKKSSWFYTRKGGNEQVYKEVFFYLCQSKTKKVKISSENTDFCWLNFNEAIKKITFENMKNVLREADKYLNNLF